MGGGTREQCGSNKACAGSTFWAPKNRTIGLIWLVTRGGGVGGVGQGGGQGGGDGGGHQRAVWEQQGIHWFHLLGSLKNLTIGLIWLVTRRVGQGGGQGGGDGGSREVGGEVERVDKMWRPLKGEPAGRRPQGSADIGEYYRGHQRGYLELRLELTDNLEDYIGDYYRSYLKGYSEFRL